MPTLTSTRPPITPATFSEYVPNPAEVSSGKVKRARRVLARARATITEKGWTQHSSQNEQGNVCLSYAIEQARQVRSKPGLLPLGSSKMSNIIAGLLEEARPQVTRRAPAFTILSDIVTWNDKSGRTKEQVLDLLSKAAGE